MSYLILNDYISRIEADNLMQVQNNNPTTRAMAEQQAQAEAISKLRQKYWTEGEFTNTNVWVPLITAPAWGANTAYEIGNQVLYNGSVYYCSTANSDPAFTAGNWTLIAVQVSQSYNANDRVYLDAPAWVANTYYAAGQLVLFTDGNIYQCNTANNDGAWTAAHWTLLGAQYTIFYAQYPQPVFDFAKGFYSIGDQVFWKNNVYTNLVPTPVIDHEAALQFYQIQNIPYTNVFPDTPTYGVINWGVGVPYSVPAGTLPTNTTYWTQGDNRDPQMVQKLIDIALYHLHSVIAPRNIPLLRVKNYMGAPEDRGMNERKGKIIYPEYSALGWLQACADGEVTPNLPLRQPPKGSRIRFGGNVKNINSY